MAGVPPATCAVASTSRAALRMISGKVLERLMRRQHVVIGGDDAEVRLGAGHGCQLVRHRLPGEGVGPVGAGQLGPSDPEPVAASMRRR
jgi:hypothetical protein